MKLFTMRSLYSVIALVFSLTTPSPGQQTFFLSSENVSQILSLDGGSSRFVPSVFTMPSTRSRVTFGLEENERLPYEDKSMSQPISTDTAGSSFNIPLAAGGAAITAVLFKTDQRTSNALFSWKNRHHFVGQVSSVVTNLGDGKASLLLFGGATVYSFFGNDQKLMDVGKVGLESYFLSGAATQFLKQVFSRQQPNLATRNGGTFYGPFAYFRQRGSIKQGSSFFDAFPSGHTATVFSAATTISDFYSQPWVSYTSYSLATISAISRITEHQHWASDVFVGGIIGYFSTQLVEKFNYHLNNFSFVPEATSYAYGMQLNVQL
jgi:membrane-associated phospholipid phosphatase